MRGARTPAKYDGKVSVNARLRGAFFSFTSSKTCHSLKCLSVSTFKVDSYLNFVTDVLVISS